MISRDEIVTYLNNTLGLAATKGDDGPCNGLQVQGVSEVRRIGLAVDACLEAYERAVAAGCQMLVVHHKLIWGSGVTSITERMHEHVSFLMRHGLNLYGSHLPLDMHPELGNNAQLAKLLGLGEAAPFGEYHGETIGFSGTLPQPLSPRELARRLGDALGGRPVVLEFGPAAICRVGIVSGGAADMLDQAVRAGLDAYITGEPMHFTYQLARELHANVIYLGHYHSETLGVRAVGQRLTERFGVENVFLDIAVPDTTWSIHEPNGV